MAKVESFDHGFRGLELLDYILKKIDTEPETWNQSTWAQENFCGTSYCVAGHAVIACGGKIRFTPGFYTADYANVNGQEATIMYHAMKFLELTDEQAELLFAGTNSREKLQSLRDDIAKQKERKERKAA